MNCRAEKTQHLLLLHRADSLQPLSPLAGLTSSAASRKQRANDETGKKAVLLWRSRWRRRQKETQGEIISDGRDDENHSN